MIKRNEELGDGLFAQINWTADDVLEIHEDWTREEAEQFLKDVVADLLDDMIDICWQMIVHHSAAEKFERVHGNW